MNSKILFPFLLITLNSCITTHPVVGTWTFPEQAGELIISQQSDKFQASMVDNGINQGTFPAEVSDKGVTFVAYAGGIGSAPYNCNCSLVSKNELDCNLVISTVLGNETRPFKLVRK